MLYADANCETCQTDFLAVVEYEGRDADGDSYRIIEAGIHEDHDVSVEI